MVAATSEVIGVIGSVHDWKLAPGFVLGYAAGAYLAVKFKVAAKA